MTVRTLRRLSNTSSTSVPSTPSVTLSLIISAGVVTGGFAALYARPLQRNLMNYSTLFRKPWMKVPLFSAFFFCGFYGGIQLPYKIFPKFSPSTNMGVDHSYYTSSADIVGKFKLFESLETPDLRDEVASYLALYSRKPIPKNEMIDKLAASTFSEPRNQDLFRVKRRGKDKDDMFWCFGKIHGLENIAFADPEEIKATNGNPVKIQKIVNRVNGP